MDNVQKHNICTAYFIRIDSSVGIAPRLSWMNEELGLDF
jgi:hypothetical protein